MRRWTLAAFLAIAAIVGCPVAAVAQVNPVYSQDPVTGAATQQQQITVPNGFADTYQAGATLTCNGCTLGAGWRTKLTAGLTQFVSATGSDVTGNGTAGNPWASCSHAYSIDQTTYDLSGFTITCSIATGTYTPFCWTFNGPLVGATTAASFTIQGPGQFGSVLSGAASCNEFYAQSGAKITITAVNMTPGASGFGMVVNHGEIDFGTVELLDNSAANNFADALGGDSTIACVSGFEYVDGASHAVNNVFVSEDHALITLNCALAMSGTVLWSGAFVQGDLGGMIDGNGFTFSGGTPTGTRFNASLNGIVHTTGGGASATFYPGTVAGVTATGGVYN